MKKAVIIMVTVILALFFCCNLMAVTLQKSIIPAEATWVIHFDLVEVCCHSNRKSLAQQ